MSADIPYLCDAITDIIRDLDRFEATGVPSNDLQPLISKLDFVQRIAVTLDVDEVVTEYVGSAYRKLVESEQSNQLQAGYQAPLNCSGGRGRPSFEISEEQLQFLLEQGFQVKDISSILGVSCRTVERRMSSFGLSVSGTKLYMCKCTTLTIHVKCYCHTVSPVKMFVSSWQDAWSSRQQESKPFHQ